MDHEAICDRFFAACEEFNQALAQMKEAGVSAKMTLEWSGKEIVSESADITRIVPTCAEKVVRYTPQEWAAKQGSVSGK